MYNFKKYPPSTAASPPHEEPAEVEDDHLTHHSADMGVSGGTPTVPPETSAHTLVASPGTTQPTPHSSHAQDGGVSVAPPRHPTAPTREDASTAHAWPSPGPAEHAEQTSAALASDAHAHAPQEQPPPTPPSHRCSPITVVSLPVIAFADRRDGVRYD